MGQRTGPGTLTQQRDRLRAELEQARETARIQEERINDLIAQLQGRVEDSGFFKTQLDSFASLKAKVNTQRISLDNQEKELKAAWKRESNLEIALAEVREENARLKAELEESRDMTRLQGERAAALEKQAQRRVEDSDQYQVGIASAQLEAERLRRDRDRLRQELDGIKRQQAAEPTERELALEAEVMRLRAEVAEIRLEDARDLERIRKDRDEGNAIIQQRDRQVTDLRYRLNQANQTIQTMRATLAALDVQEAAGAQAAGYEKAQRGRPARIDGGTRARIRQLHADGMAVREISRREGVSVGMISKILNE